MTRAVALTCALVNAGVFALACVRLAGRTGWPFVFGLTLCLLSYLAFSISATMAVFPPKGDS